MKLICTNTDGCGFYSLVKELENLDHQNRCPECFSLAIEVSKGHTPLLSIEDPHEFQTKACAILAKAINSSIQEE